MDPQSLALAPVTLWKCKGWEQSRGAWKSSGLIRKRITSRSREQRDIHTEVHGEIRANVHKLQREKFKFSIRIKIFTTNTWPGAKMCNLQLVKNLPWRWLKRNWTRLWTQDWDCPKERLGLMIIGPFQAKTFRGSMWGAHLNQNCELNEEQQPSEAQNGLRSASETTHRSHSPTSRPITLLKTQTDPDIHSKSERYNWKTNATFTFSPLGIALWATTFRTQHNPTYRFYSVQAGNPHDPLKRRKIHAYLCFSSSPPQNRHNSISFSPQWSEI